MSLYKSLLPILLLLPVQFFAQIPNTYEGPITPGMPYTIVPDSLVPFDAEDEPFEQAIIYTKRNIRQVRRVYYHLEELDKLNLGDPVQLQIPWDYNTTKVLFFDSLAKQLSRSDDTGIRYTYFFSEMRNAPRFFSGGFLGNTTVISYDYGPEYYSGRFSALPGNYDLEATEWRVNPRWGWIVQFCDEEHFPCSSSIEERIGATMIQASPNPCKEHLIVSLGGRYDFFTCTVHIIDEMGRIVWEELVGVDTGVLRIEGVKFASLRSGVYTAGINLEQEGLRYVRFLKM